MSEDPPQPATIGAGALGDQLAYESENGDSWYFSKHPASGLPAIKHVANPFSGGHISYIDVDSFLARGNGPEQQAVRRLIASESSATILIAYDVHPGQGPRYDHLVEAIQSLGAWWHHLETAWIVRSSKTPDEIKESLRDHIGADDQLLVVDISGDRAAWAGVNQAGSAWLRENIGQAAVV